MAPTTDVTKTTPKGPRNAVKTIGFKNKQSPATTIKKTIASTKKKIERIPFKMNTNAETRQRTSTAPKVNPVNPKENNSAPVAPNSVKKPTWKRRPKAAHSGVPVPEKMKALIQKQFKDLGSL